MTRADYFPTRPRGPGQSHRYMIQCPATGIWLPAALHADAKTAPSVIFESTGRATATVANAWILPVGPPALGGSCASTTGPCQSCYAASLEAAYTSLAMMAADNLASVRHVAAHGVDALAAWLAVMVDQSVAEQHALGIRRPTFRWHSGGDIGALVGTGIPRHTYPRAIRKACRMTPNVEHWLYTRELWALGSVTGPDNLSVYVSVDEDNLTDAAAAAARHSLPVALLANDEAHAATLWDQIRSKWPNLAPHLACPATGKWRHDNRGPAHIVGPDGRRSSLTRGETAVGACVACRACLPGGAPRSVTFHMHNPGARLDAAVRRRIPVSVAP